MKILREFNCYSFIKNVNGGQQWKKRHQGGQTATMMIYKSRVSRKDVINAFLEQENEVLEFGIEEYRKNNG